MKGPVLTIIIFFACVIAVFALGKILHLRQKGFFNRKSTFKIIDRIIITFSAGAIFISLLYDINFIQYKAPIPHKDWNSISLKDFRGFKKPSRTLHGESNFAFVVTSIRTKMKSDSVEIESLFHPSRSYVFNRDLFSERLLEHEMYHFHITEYCARLLRKEISLLAEEGKPIDLNKMKKAVLKKEQALQRQYDEETYHSYLLGKQLKWQNRIDSSLLSLEDYSGSIISLKN